MYHCATCGWRKDLGWYELAGARALLCRQCAAGRSEIEWTALDSREKLALAGSQLVHLSRDEKSRGPGKRLP